MTRLATITDAEIEGPFGGLAQTITALNAGENAFRRHPVFVGPDGMRLTAAYHDGLAAVPGLAERLSGLLAPVLHRLVARNPDASSLVLALPRALDQLGETARFRALMAAALPEAPGQIAFVLGGHCAAPMALAQATAPLAEGRPVIWAAVDSCLAPARVDLDCLLRPGLAQGGPYAPVPGEAAAACLLLPPDAAGPGLAFPVSATEPLSADQVDRPVLGRGLARVLAQIDLAGGDFGTLMSDLDGERFRAEEFGLVAPDLPERLRASPFCPALVMGRLGTAYPLISAILAAHLPAGSLILCSDPDEMRAGLTVFPA